MCTKPNLIDGYQFACKKCNDCIGSRKNEWVARACAEKVTAGNAMVFMLSYRNLPSGDLPDGARVFCYKHIQLFLKRVRKAYFKHYGKVSEISYIVAGEMGSERDRVHWHIVLFSNQSLHPLGVFTDLYTHQVTDGPVVTAKGVNQLWSLWDHGFVCPQIPDEGGMAYVLKYAMKDQYNVKKSKGEAREANAENHSSGMFRMSKRVPLGARWLASQCDEWAQLGVVPTSLQLKVPETKGYWYPVGDFRLYLCMRLWAINEQYRLDHGRDCPQWSSLIHSVVSKKNTNPDDKYEISKDFELLTYGELANGPKTYDKAADRRETEIYHRYQEGRKRAQHASAEVKQCGNIVPCSSCLIVLSQSAIDAYRRYEKQSFATWRYSQEQQGHSDLCKHTFRKWWQSHFRVSQGCERKDTHQSRAAFAERQSLDKLSAYFREKGSSQR